MGAMHHIGFGLSAACTSHTQHGADCDLCPTAALEVHETGFPERSMMHSSHDPGAHEDNCFCPYCAQVQEEKGLDQMREALA